MSFRYNSCLHPAGIRASGIAGTAIQRLPDSGETKRIGENAGTK
jgi:hypothetical protein